jgi:sulfide:quinone oxidoreductase
VPGVKDIYAAGDATEFPIKMGGIGSQQADVVAQSIAALAGTSVTAERFDPMIHGMLMTHEQPRYLTAHITGGHGFSSEITDTPTWSPPRKIAAKYLAPYLEEQDRESGSLAGISA